MERPQASTVPTVLPIVTGHVKTRPPRLVRMGWFLYAAAWVVLALWWTFPTDLLLQRIVVTVGQEWGLRIRYGDGDWQWRDGWVLRDLSIAGLAQAASPMHISRFTLRPSLIGLFRRLPLPMSFRADLAGGTVTGMVRQEAEGVHSYFTIHGLTLEQWPLPLPWEKGQIIGNLTAEGEVRGDFARLSSLSGTLMMDLTESALKAGQLNGIRVPALRPLQAHVHATLAGGQVNVTEFQVHADGIAAQIEGRIMLREPLTQSRLALRLTTRVSGSPSPALTTLVSLLPVSPSGAEERRGLISGTLAAPVLR